MTKTESAQDVIASFDRLPMTERAVVVREITKRLKQQREEAEGGPLEDDELIYVSDQFFQMYDREEEQNGSA